MKAQEINDRGLDLQKKNNRWKWMAGATAATAAGVAAPQVSAIMINLTGNYISAEGGNHLNADLTGDGHPDLTIANPFHSLNNTFTFGSGIPNPYYGYFHAGVKLNGILASAVRQNDGLPYSGSERLGSRGAGFYRHFGSCPSCVYGTYSITGSIPLFFKDLHINGGAPTSGSLEVTVTTADGDLFFGGAEVRLDSFSYDTPVQRLSHSVPDQGPSLALLAMGAGGILALRRWRVAQGRS